MLSMILAMDKNKLVGGSSAKYGIPWHHPEDLKFYKNKTIGKINIMGRTTYESIGKALPNRDTYVLTTNKDLKYEDANMLYSIDEALNLINSNKDQEVMLVGGVKVFETLKEYVDVIYLTRIDLEYVGDVYYKNFNTNCFSLEEKKVGENKKLIFEKWVKNI